MKKIFYAMLGLLFCAACTGVKKEQPITDDATSGDPAAIADTAVASKSFDELFQPIEVTQLTDNVFKLVGQDYTVITAGDSVSYNSMTASWGGWGILFSKPATWCFLRASRYTLELMKKEQTYTMSYFNDLYKEDVLFFGSKTGRDTDKMKESRLTGVLTPSGNTTFKEARLVLECKLMEVTTVHPDDFYDQEYVDFVVSGFNDAKAYHKMVFGEITKVWIRK
ncbi:MAG: flavin reductase [Dysgonamonadaceae bacterium]|jgi:flavin reductase (DIM6/NTAB) family NADH-FMN oxidoreductase RutF|nr:flavin reductase [Dysgonamonadaceae bacterium]